MKFLRLSRCVVTDHPTLKAAVTFGAPLKNYQQFGPGTWGSLPSDRTLVFCNSGDGVCGGAFSISAAHLSYTSNGDIAKGVAFVSKMVDALGSKALEAAPPPAGANTGAYPAGAGGAPGAGGPPPKGGAPKGAGGAPSKGGAPPKGGAGGPKAGGGMPKGGSGPPAAPPAAEAPASDSPAPDAAGDSS